MNVSPYVCLAAGALALVLGVLLYRSARRYRIAAMVIMLAAAVALLVGAKPALLQHAVSIRVRASMLAVSLFILYLTFDRVRHTSLKERYALLWILTSLVFFGLGLFPDAIIGFLQLSGMHYTSAIMALVFVFLLTVCFHFSLALSRSEDDRRKLAQALALLENRVRKLERGGPAEAPHEKDLPQ